MDMLEWAKNEVNIACKYEAPNRKDDEWDYGCACYESALKAYESLLNDGHSGFSWSMTKSILNKLMDGQPLTPITDEDFDDNKLLVHESESFLKDAKLKSHKQCPRMSSLFREEHLDGSITYSDVDRYYCIDVNDPRFTYSGGGACKIIDELFPITMPYSPKHGKYIIYTEDFLVDESMGDFDTKAYYYVITPEGKRVDINRFMKEIKIGNEISETIEYETFKPSENSDELIPTTENYTHTYTPTKWVSITEEELNQRKLNRIERD